ncbi:MAG: bacteriohopanetetrol glucosamine biosynthesis glycosyltransferase HpnI [Janthinobacterium lividum]
MPTIVTTVLAWVPPLLALVSVVYTLGATLAVRAFARAPLPPAAAPEPAVLLKPLHGAEPRLAANLATFLDQDWPAPVRMVAGTNRADDPALAALGGLKGDVAVRTGAPPLGANGKIANLVNMMPDADAVLLILSDSDMAGPRDYVPRVAAALAQPGVGAVTCAYRGRGDAMGAGAGWSRFAAAGISYQFAPGVVTSWALGVGGACMGSTIALRRPTLDAIGGFAAFADVLADDHAIGAAVRALGLSVRPVPRMVLAHGCTERSMVAVWRHELRWAATVRGVDPAGHVGSLLTHPLALALLSLPSTPRAGVVAVVLALAARCSLAATVDAWVGERSAPRWWLPVRDLFSFGVFVASFVARSVDWRGATLRMEANGRMTAEPEHP